MLDIVVEVLSGITEAIFGDWYARQPILIKVLAWGAIITFVLLILSLFLPEVIGFITGLAK